MKEQFTQGDWINEGTTVYALQDSLCPGMPSKENRFYFGVQGKCSDEELLANAVLAKAAPKMYRMLEDAMCLLAENDKECKALSKEIRLLRAEARGENNEN